MGSFAIKKNKINSENILIFDIGSGSIGGAIVKVFKEENKLPVILKSIRLDIQNSDNFETLFSNTIKSLNSVLSSIASFSKISNIYCFLSAPWYVSEIRNITLEKDIKSIFTVKQGDDILKKEIKKVSDKYQESMSVIDSTIMNFKLNGYNINNPIGKKYKQIDFDLFISITPEILLTNLKETIYKYLPNSKINFSSFVSSSFISLREKCLKPDSYIFIDVSAEVTEIAIVNNGSIKHSMTFPFGKKSIIRHISKKKNLDFRDSKELFNLYISKRISENIRINIDNTIKEVEILWLQNFYKCLEHVDKNIVIPSFIFITADDDIKNWISDIIKNKKDKFNFEILSIEGNLFLDLCDIESGLCDPFLMIESIFVNKRNI
jgi:cell division ATPase FtsA